MFVQAKAGHAQGSTTERYLHSKPRHTDVARLDRAFAAEPTLTSVHEQAGAATEGGPDR